MGGIRRRRMPDMLLTFQVPWESQNCLVCFPNDLRTCTVVQTGLGRHGLRLVTLVGDLVV